MLYVPTSVPRVNFQGRFIGEMQKAFEVVIHYGNWLQHEPVVQGTLWLCLLYCWCIPPLLLIGCGSSSLTQILNSQDTLILHIRTDGKLLRDSCHGMLGEDGVLCKSPHCFPCYMPVS